MRGGGTHRERKRERETTKDNLCVSDMSGNIPVSALLFRVGDDRCCSLLMATRFNLVEQSIAPKLFTLFMLLGDDGIV